jgi:hypothetical protein
MFEELNLDELHELLRQLETRQAETERLIREVTTRIRLTTMMLEGSGQETRYPTRRDSS